MQRQLGHVFDAQRPAHHLRRRPNVPTGRRPLRGAGVRCMRMLAGLRNTVEERDDSRLQRVFGADNEEPVLPNELFEEFRAMA